ncbi:hypothetical protein HYC85_003181 [Camellia sinensis]|uniref:Transmembrane protein n=1 Tax=Camellia sinensis TaxID=4442 RepID=A0A7J7IAK0_CAMSI|nr:hypothetical protein HYC85_003181 [Camellia sinensis]
MQILGTSDATTLNYWLNLRVLICAIWVLTPMFIGLYMIWKYECLDCSESEKITQQERSGFLYHDEAWRPCLKEIHPVWLLVFRVIAFFLLLGTIIADVVVHGCSILYYYTHLMMLFGCSTGGLLFWSPSILGYTSYFLCISLVFVPIFGSLLSIYGCYQNNKMCMASNGHYVGIDAEQGLSVPLTYRETAYRVE